MPPKAKPKKANGYDRPAEIKLGTVLTDNMKNSWKVGPSIGSGGFGDIYSCISAGGGHSKKAEDYPHVLKIEPHSNGPLFVEMHFYARNCKQDEIEKFRISRGWKYLGIPQLIGHGSQDVGGVRHRFLVIPRYGTDVWKLFLNNNRKFPAHTTFRIGLQMINVLEYMHSRGYVHADLKGANILLGTGKTGAEECYLVDFGLANHFNTKEYKPNPKFAHNGTIEYTSRDAHLGVSTMRGDMEILGYNMVHWLGLDLPWETQKLLTNPKKVQESKEQYMKSLDKHLATAPEAIRSFMKYVEQMQPDDAPDYVKCRGYLEKGLKVLGKDNKGVLEFGTITTKAAASPRKRVRDASSGPAGKATPVAVAPLRERKRKQVLSDSEDDDVFEQSAGRRQQPAKKKNESVKSGRSPSKTPPSAKKPRTRTVPARVSSTKKNYKDDSSIIILDSPLTDNGPTPKVEKAKDRPQGKVTVNNEITPTTRPRTGKKVKKTYEFDIALDVSYDAEVIVNVRRNQKKKRTSTPTLNDAPTPSVPSSVKAEVATSSSGTPITPVVRKRVVRTVNVTPSGSVQVRKG